MQLQALLGELGLTNDLNPFVRVPPNADVTRLSFDSRQVDASTVFVAVRGAQRDGHRYLPEVTAKGPLAVVVEDTSLVPPEYQGIVAVVPDGRKALAQLARTFYGAPARELISLGVTGTNGKTTVTYMIEAILNLHGWPTGVLGTIDHHLVDPAGHTQRWPSELTTPDPLTLQRRLRELVTAGARAVAMEISSHALDQSRADGMDLRAAVFTNFTRDHLDYHGDMDHYFAAKQKMFMSVLSDGGTAVLNYDDLRVRQTQVRPGAKVVWFGGPGATFAFANERRSLGGTTFTLSTPDGPQDFELPCPGPHNVANAAAAVAACVAVGISLGTAARALTQFRGAPGRLERVADEKGRFIFVDYAHTDDALRSVLAALDGLRGKGPKRARILTVFGCGGDRDRGKRPLMARAACAYSDAVILTSDNPRGENPEDILDQIARGIPSGWSGRVRREVDRRSALRTALQMADEGDVILVAGKGHEDYQIIGDRRLHFSDREVLIDLTGGESRR